MNDLGIVEAAQVFGISADTVRRHIKAGKLAAQRDERGRWRVTMPPLSRAEAGNESPMHLKIDHLQGHEADLTTRALTVPDTEVRRELECVRAVLSETQKRANLAELVVADLRKQIEERSKAEAELRHLLTQVYVQVFAGHRPPVPSNGPAER